MDVFEEIVGFLEGVGVIDGIDKVFKGLMMDLEDYFENVFGNVGCKVKFLDVSVGCFGGMYDVCVFRYSRFYEWIESGEIFG